MKGKEYLYEMYNATSTDDGNGDLETYENWLERQLLSRIKRLKKSEEREQRLVNSLQKVNAMLKASIKRQTQGCVIDSIREAECLIEELQKQEQ